MTSTLQRGRCARAGALRRLGVAAVAVLSVAACGSSGATSARPSASPTSHAASVAVVAIGDSDATGAGDASGRGWVGRYGDLLKQRLGVPVNVDNEAAEGKTSEQLRGEVAADEALRTKLAHADVILIGIGGADLNAGDDALSAGPCKGRQCYADVLRTFDTNIGAIAHDVRQVAPSALLRAMSLPNALPGAGAAVPLSPRVSAATAADLGRYQVTAERASVCRAMASYDGRCVDVVRAFNGANAGGDAYTTGLMTKDPCCYPSADGQQLIAKLLLAAGVGDLPHH